MASSKRTDKERQANKQRSLRLIKSLDPDDDERTTISKKISWILRQGAKVAGVPQDADRWVLVSDLLNAEILAGLDLNVLNKVIVDSNSRKLRYELQETASGTMIRAYTKEERKEREAASGVLGVKPDKYSGDGQLRDSAAAYVPPPASSQAAPQGMVAAAAAAAAMPWPQTSYPMSPTGADMGMQMQTQGWPGMGFNPMMMHFMNPWMNWQQQAAAQAAQQQPGKFAGRIKSFNAEKGFGFIECAHTFAQYNRDVFLHKAQIGDVPVGSFVSFTCEVNKQGMPQAKEVATIGPPPAPGAKGAIGGKGAKGGKGEEGKGKKGKGKGKDKDEGGKGKKGKGKKGKEQKEGDEDATDKDQGAAEEGGKAEEGGTAEEAGQAEEGGKEEKAEESKAAEGGKAEEAGEKATEAKAEEAKEEAKSS